jgi:hypothetical protein
MMLVSFVLLAFKTGEFTQDIVFPAVAGAVVIVLILNSLLSKWGFRLW